MTQEQRYTISQVAAQLKISKSKIRYYIEAGLVKPETSSTNGYRIFNKRDIFLINLIVELRQLHMTVEKIKTIFEYGNEITINQIFIEHLNELEHKYEELGNVIKILNLIIANENEV